MDWLYILAVQVTLESLGDCKEIQPAHPKKDQSWVFIGRTDAKAETPILWPPDAKNWLIWKNPDAGKVWQCEEKGMKEDEKLDGTTDSMDMSLNTLRDLMMDSEASCLAVHGISKSQTQRSDWTELTDFSPKEIRSIYLSLEGKQMSPNDQTYFCLDYNLKNKAEARKYLPLWKGEC